MRYYVDASAAFPGKGSEKEPFRTISQAAAIACLGDEVIVAPGIYRETVSPANGGTADARIVYRAACPGKAVITGAEEVKNWENLGGGIWRARVGNGIFKDRSPYTTLISGDWYIPRREMHTGDVFLNGKSLYEVTTKDEIFSPVPSKTSWDPDFSVYTWHCEQDGDETVFLANFHGLDPNRENVEISARKTCFWPEEEGRGYITVSGFVLCQAATQWAPPTAYQEGLIGPHWSKGWIIENCEVFESKCVGISLGKYYQPYDENRWLKEKTKDGAQTMVELIFSALREGWSMDAVGSHTVRACHIHDCGQSGIGGNLGGAGSVIEHNHIHNINNKQNLTGAEIAGIKMHAAIDVVYRHNHIHHCTRGMWLDWEAQGTRVTGNLFHDNCLPHEFLMRPGSGTVGEDIWIEVSHGPTLLDRNIFLSPRAVRFATQGVAMVHNLIAGSLTAIGRGTQNGAPTKVSPRPVPYHVPHSTEVAGYMTILHGDDRFYNNIFVQKPFHPYLVSVAERSRDNQWDDGNLTVGTWPFDAYPTKKEWDAQFEGYCGEGGVRTDRYYDPLPVYAAGNVYFNGARPWRGEESPVVDAQNRITLELKEDGEGVYLASNLGDFLPEGGMLVDTAALGKAFEPDQAYENPDGTPIVFDTDYFGEKSGKAPIPGPFADKADYKGEKRL